jgi:hypothetical protein
MTVTNTQWHIYNKGYYCAVKQDSETDLAIDLQNELKTGDYLTIVTFTTASTDITIAKQAVRFDALQGFTNPHQAQCTVQSSTLGAHAVTMTVTTNGGLTHVKHFDVLIER